MARQRFEEDQEAIVAGPGVLRLVAADLDRVLAGGPGGCLRVRDVFARLAEEGLEAWVVGGAPRDWLEGRVCGDLDIAVRTGFCRLERFVRGAFAEGGVREAYPDFGLLKWESGLGGLDFNILRALPAPVPGRSMFEQRHRPARHLGEDAMLRDFTLNAIYFSPARGLFLDPTRRGVAAIAGKILEFAGPSHLANTNPFLPLRVVKFMAKGYRPTEEVERFLWMHLEETITAMDPGLLSQWFSRQLPPGLAKEFRRIMASYLTSAAWMQVAQGRTGPAGPWSG